MTGNRPCSLLVPHVRRLDTHGWIGTRPGCLACAEYYGDDYFRPDCNDMITKESAQNVPSDEAKRAATQVNGRV